MSDLEKLIADNMWRPVKELDFIKMKENDTEILGRCIDGKNEYYSIASILYINDDGSPYWWDRERTGFEVEHYRVLPIDDRLATVCEVLVKALQDISKGNISYIGRANQALKQAEEIAVK